MMATVLKFLKTYLGKGLGLLTDWSIFFAIVLIGGYGTSWYMVQAGSELTTQRIGPWVAWTAQARSDADPYTRAHFAKRGTLDLSTETAVTFITRGDKNNDPFDASCVYRVEGDDLAADWWSLTLYDAQGRLVKNTAERYSFTKDTVAFAPDGTFKVSLARDAHSGNWLPFGRASNFALALHLLQPDISILSEEDNADQLILPEVIKEGCQ